MPITILNKNNGKDSEISNKYNPYVLKTIVDVDANNIDKYKIYLTNTKDNPKFYISECATFEYSAGS